MKIAIIGGGAAGFFTAISAKKINPQATVVIFEKSLQLLSKVKISGGGRCNVTHYCYDPTELVKNYPRGSKELLGPFYRFSPKDTVHFFESLGVKLKVEEDHRMFPVSDSSLDIIECLVTYAKELGISISKKSSIQEIQKNASQFELLTRDETLFFDRVALTTGSSKQGFLWASAVGHTIEKLIPSLFTLNIENFSLKDLSGTVAQNATISINQGKITQTGPLLITHFGLSGPCALKLSAFGAKYFYECDYRLPVKVNWVSMPEEKVFEMLIQKKAQSPSLSIKSIKEFSLTKSLWSALILNAGLNPGQKLQETTDKKLRALAKEVSEGTFDVKGKTTNKSEFVTCGGVKLSEVDFKTMQSKICKGLYFAGEILDIDGVTGGFNFQNAWTTGYIAGNAIGESIGKSN